MLQLSANSAGVLCILDAGEALAGAAWHCGLLLSIMKRVEYLMPEKIARDAG
jgi:hypothetical protein